ncbi:glycosyltransferase [Dechloromonas sp. HYN0024]|uniref:glycosyltransferase n=1 Tax=Dechloromonas sp. HYN0024 TaxID=2231055 RepID=UPI000E449E02|nr:glycosyltransferase [Dechloromonas sp. HYN0024]AXS80362.1 glycosyltransferase [Dechloromonas sp. HYN0024]
MKKIAVLLAAFNGELWLHQQIDSILKQESVDLSLFVSLDPSDDGSETLVRNLAASDSRIVLLPIIAPSGGAGANFFRLIRDVDFSGFDSIAFADQDDIWYPDKLSRAIEALSESGAAGYSSNVVAFWDDGRELLVDKAQSQTQFDFLFEAAGPGCTYVLKRSALEQFKALLFAEAAQVRGVTLHDWFVYAFFRAKGYQWIIDPRTSMAYRQHALNQVGVNAGWKAYKARARKMVGGWWMSQARLIARLTGLASEPFCMPWRQPGRMGMLWLVLNSLKARRKASDKFFFAAACFFLAVIGDGSDE